MEKFSYPKFYQTLSRGYVYHPRAKKILFTVDKLATYLVFLAYVSGFFILVFGKTPLFSWRFLSFLGFPFLSLVCVLLLRVFIKRKRPYEQGVTPLIEKNSTGNSFPSRHTTSAFAIGVSLIPVFLPLGILSLVCGLIFFYTRMVLGWHYPSDLLIGGVLGASLGALCFL